MKPQVTEEQAARVQKMHSVIVCWGETGCPYTPVGTVTRLGLTHEPAILAAQDWCQAQANLLAEDVLPLHEWQHYLSRGTGPHTAHYTTTSPDGTFAIFIIGELT